MADTLTIGPYVVGEKPAPLVYQFLDSAGAPINLTGYATPEFHFQRTDSSTTVTGAAVVTDAANGKVSHVWLGTEFTTPGRWWCEFWVGNGTQRYASKRMEARVRAAVGTAPAI
jgi:hypothetical protein